MSIVLDILILLTGLAVGAAVPFLLKKRIFAGEYHKVETLKRGLEEKYESEFESQKKKVVSDQ